jgi:hypothetical protein
MDNVERLQSRRATELNQALASACSQKRGLHEEQARALGKIIGVLHREGREAAKRLRPLAESRS